jgi:putative transposase
MSTWTCAAPYTVPTDTPRFITGGCSRDVREEFAHLRKLPSLWTGAFFLSTAANVRQESSQKYSERPSKA